MHPFNAKDFVQSLVKQFRSTVAVEGLLEEDKTWQELAEELKGYVNEKGYLVVLNDLATIEEWDDIKVCFPNNKKGSRIIVCTRQVEVASLCLGQESQVLELKQFSTDQSIYAFYEKDGTNSPTLLPSSDAATTSTLNLVAPTNEILGNQSKGSKDRKVVRNNLTRINTITNALEESKLIGREKEKSDVAGLISDKLGQQFSVISIWGMGGLGKTTLIKDVYQNQHLIGLFEKCVFVTVMRPFILKELLKSLMMQLDTESSEKRRSIMDLGGGTRKELATVGLQEVARLLEGFKCLIVLDDLSSTTEWDMIVQSFSKMEKTSRIIITTREENIAKYCSQKQENIYKLKMLKHEDALDLFTRKVFKVAIDLEQYCPDLIEEAKLILKKCNGLPIAIVTIGGFLANQPKTAMEWRKLNEHIGAELEINPELEAIRTILSTILSKSSDGLPYHLKSCFLYLSIFPEDHKLSRRRLTWWWTAEGYSREIREADRYFMELIDRSMILPCQETVFSRKGFDSCQVHDFMPEISISKSTEENLVFRLEEGCRSNTHSTVRHLTISSNWEGDKRDFESMVDLTRIRSLTVFGKWRPFFISNKMSVLRILDLENTENLRDHHLEQIGKLHHLQYLSLRGCQYIFHLPDSLGNLKQLQTLDIKQTAILNLPKTIINLRKLQYIHSNTLWVMDKRCLCSYFCCIMHRPIIISELVVSYGIVLPRGFRKLRLLHTLGVVNIAAGKDILKDIKALTQLRGLAVTGIDKKNFGEFCCTLDHLRCLEFLTVHSMSEPGLQGCLDYVSSPPKNLQSLKVSGNLVKLPEWIGGLSSLVKLKLKETMLSELDATIQVLGKLPNLAILCLLTGSFKGEELNLSFHREAFPSLVVLQLTCISDDLRSVEFGEEATPKLELLSFIGYPSSSNAGIFSGLASLPRLKEFMLDNDKYEEDFLTHVQDQLDGNPNGPVMKRGAKFRSSV